MKIRFGLLLLILISLWLRFIQANFNYTPLFGDEWVLSGASLNMMVTGTLKNLFFGYGDVCKIPYLILDVFTFLIGVWRGVYTHVSDVAPYETFVFANRLWNVTLGALSIGVAYRLGEKLVSSRLGWILALLVFANPLQFKYSLYTNPDQTAFFFMLLSMVFALDIASVEKKTAWKGYLFSAVCVALSIGAKVNHLFAILFPLMMHFYVRPGNLLEKIFNLKLITFFSITGVSYLLVSPTVLLSFPIYFDFWLRFFFAPEGHIGERQVYSTSQFILLFEEIIKILGLAVLFGFSCLGLLFLWRKREHQSIAIIGLLLLLFFSTVINAKTSYRMDAHALFPMLPFILIFTGFGIEKVSPFLFSRFSYKRIGPIVITALLILFPLCKYIVNWEVDYTYFGGGNKQSFWQYLFTGKVPVNQTPLNELSATQKRFLDQTNPSLPVALKGVQETWGGLYSVEKVDTLNLEYRLSSSSEILPSLITVTLTGFEKNRDKIFLRQNQKYLLSDQGEWNWRQKGRVVPVKKDQNGLYSVSIPILKTESFEKVLLQVQLHSPYKTTQVELNRVEFK